ncbi:MAG: hypothetical protein ACYTEE_11355 [Planctomycetota bacterium]
MVDIHRWHTRGVCPECGWHSFYDDWAVKTMIYVPNPLWKWWNPKTWGLRGMWVTKDKIGEK